MTQSYFNNVVKKISKTKKRIIDAKKLKKLIYDVMEKNYTDKKAYKMIYYLKNKGHILSLKKDIFYITSPDEEKNFENIIEEHYRNILREHCKNFLEGDFYIGGIKALELNISNYSIPEDIELINDTKQSKEVLAGEKKVIFKKYSSNNQSLFKKLKKYTYKIKIGKYSFKVASIELSLLESLYNTNILNEKYSEELVKKVLKKYKKHLDFEKIDGILTLGKHHSSINRLHKISKNIDSKLEKSLVEKIKKNSFILGTD